MSEFFLSLINFFQIDNAELQAQLAAQNEFKLKLMASRCDEYKQMALSAKKENDKTTAIACFSTMKAIQKAIDEKNFDFDLPGKPTKIESQRISPPTTKKPITG